MNSGSKQNLNWFFNNWFFSNNYIDLAVTKVSATRGKNVISIKKEGGFAIQFDVNINYTDGTKQTLHQTPARWKANQKQASVSVNSKKKIKAVELDGGIFMDATPKDNRWGL
jgi:hypothetical protein